MKTRTEIRRMVVAEGAHEHALRSGSTIVTERPEEFAMKMFFSFIVGEQADCLKPVNFDFLRGRGSWLKVVLAVTGASGVVYGVTLASELAKAGTELTIIVSDAAKRVLAEETEDGLKQLEAQGRLLTEHDIDADIASGSARTDAVVVCPCSMKTIAAIAYGYAYNLICRTADVAIKEQRRLVLVVREMPFSAIHLENMLKLAKLGAVILPASPGFYHEPKTVNDMVDHVIGKVLDVLGIESELYKRWSG